MTRTLIAVLLLALTACGPLERFEGVESLPLPGGTDLGERPYPVTIEFADALDLVPHSLCRLNDVPVGMVTSIVLAVPWHAEVVCMIRRDAALPALTSAAISQTSLLGEKYVRLEPHGTGALPGRIPLNRTTQTAEVEQVLAAASLLLNGGGLEQIATITTELNAVLNGRTSRTRHLLHTLTRLTTHLDTEKSSIVHLIDNLDRLATRLAAGRSTITAIATEITPAVTQLADQRKGLTTLLYGLRHLGRTATRVITRSSADTLADLRHLRTLLANLDKARRSLAGALPTALTFPFPASATDLLRGDYGNVDVTVDLLNQDRP